MKARLALIAILLVTLTSACQPASQPSTQGGQVRVVAVESFLADLAQNVAGSRLKVETLMPLGADPHEYEPTPQDLAKISNSSLLIVNGGGIEYWLQKSLQNAGGQHLVITASQGLKSRPVPGGSSTGEPVDPHFWLDPNLAIHYVDTIRDGLIQVDPAGASTYRQNADRYTASLKSLDAWIRTQVETIPPARRLLVTNHEALGYYADRYGFRIVGTVIPSVSTEAAPSARQLADLITAIRQTGTPAIFLEKGSNPQLADQIAQETGVKVVNDLYLETLTPPGGPAPNYLSMMRYDTTVIVGALR